MEVNPLSVIFVKSDSKGDRLLFRYPYREQENNETFNTQKKNPYSFNVAEDLLQSPPPPTSNISKGILTGISDEVLSSLFAVKPELRNQKFELKINDVRFVGHPTLLQLRHKSQDESGLLLINIVFTLQALASYSIVKCYHDLSKRMGIALRHEEQRCGYVSEQILQMVTIHDDSFSSNKEATFKKLLDKCTLAKNIKNLYGDLYTSGLVNIRINKWIPLSFCLPQKVHQWHLRGKIVEPDDIDRCIRALRPYHSLLLLYPVEQLHHFTSLDGSPSLVRMFSQYSPLKTLQTLAIDSDITLSHLFELTAHLVYWAKATVIYPICSTNKYVIAPDAPIQMNSHLNDKFSELFPNTNLIRLISDFSLPISLGQKCTPMSHPSQQSQLVEMIIWLLQHHLLIQLHTYVQYIPTNHGFSTQNSTDIRIVHRVTPTLQNNGMLSAPNFTRSPRESRTESESETSLISGTPEPELSGTHMLVNVSFSSADDEKQEYQELLLDFPDEERMAIFKIPSANNPEDLNLFANLYRNSHFHGNHHIEEIMYIENLRRSQLLQLLDKFRDVLITYETQDPAIATFFYST